MGPVVLDTEKSFGPTKIESVARMEDVPCLISTPEGQEVTTSAVQFAGGASETWEKLLVEKRYFVPTAPRPGTQSSCVLTLELGPKTFAGAGLVIWILDGVDCSLSQSEAAIENSSTGKLRDPIRAEKMEWGASGSYMTLDPRTDPCAMVSVPVTLNASMQFPERELWCELRLRAMCSHHHGPEKKTHIP